jgi:hypothetical protein
MRSRDYSNSLFNRAGLCYYKHTSQFPFPPMFPNSSPLVAPRHSFATGTRTTSGTRPRSYAASTSRRRRARCVSFARTLASSHLYNRRSSERRIVDTTSVCGRSLARSRANEQRRNSSRGKSRRLRSARGKNDASIRDVFFVYFITFVVIMHAIPGEEWLESDACLVRPLTPVPRSGAMSSKSHHAPLTVGSNVQLWFLFQMPAIFSILSHLRIT